MINMDWSLSFKEGTREYRIDELNIRQIPDKFEILDSDRIPFITCFTRRAQLEMNTGFTQFGRTISLNTLLQIFISGRRIVKVKTRGQFYLVGKGILMNMDHEILAMLCVSSYFYHNFSRSVSFSGGQVHFNQPVTLSAENIRQHFTLVLNRTLMDNPSFKTLFTRLHRLAAGAQCNILTTWQPEEGVFLKKQFPRFATIDDRRQFTDGLTEEVIENVLIRQVS